MRKGPDRLHQGIAVTLANMEGHAHCFQGRSHHAESCSPYFSVFEVCDLPRGLGSVGVVCLAIAVLEKQSAS